MPTTLIVTEKPDAALHVAEALATEQSPNEVSVDGVPFFEIRKHDERILVCSALGHLYAVSTKRNEPRSHYPVWELTWKPMHLVERGRRRQERWISSIAKVSKEANRFMNACDFDLEGSVIGYTILKYACDGADEKAQRMKFSTLTPKELRDAYSNPMPHLDFPLAFAGMCRHEIDWLYGVNLSRALTQSALKATARYTTLSTGRVQGPTLRFVVDREREIETFVPVPYWVLNSQVKVDGKLIEAEYQFERLESEAQAQRAVRECKGKTGQIEKLESKTYQLLPPPPFDLSALQGEAYRHLGYTPRAALAIAERLYLDQLISYPRTSSQKLPTSIGYEQILKGLGQAEAYRSETSTLLSSGNLRPNEGQKTDPAHPAVYPTGKLPSRELESRAQRLFDLVVRRFLATFGKPATKESDKATVTVGVHQFFLRGSRILARGWIQFYEPYAKFEEVTLPPLKEGQNVTMESIALQQKYTQPPPRYNPSSLLKAMEEAEIGTKATRAETIETLYKRGYVTGQRMAATPLAFRIVEILLKYCPKVIDVSFTRELEAKMEQIEYGKQAKEEVVRETVEYLKPLIEQLRTKELQVGKELTAIIRDMRHDSITLFAPCPKCGSELKVVRNPQTRKRFIGCAGKWKNGCSFSLPLPQVGALSLLEKRCPECGFQLVQVKARGRRTMISCSNCYARKSKGSLRDSRGEAELRNSIDPTLTQKPS